MAMADINLRSHHMFTRYPMTALPSETQVPQQAVRLHGALLQVLVQAARDALPTHCGQPLRPGTEAHHRPVPHPQRMRLLRG